MTQPMGRGQTPPAKPADPRSPLEGFVARDASTLTEVLAAADAQGHTGQFRAVGPATVECLSCHATTPAGAIASTKIVRLEGASDPADMLCVVWLACPACATPGTLVLNYGPEAGPEDAAVLGQLEDARPRV